MHYDIVPEFNILFKDDTFKFKNPFHIGSIAYALSYLGYLYTEKTTCKETFLNENLGVSGIDKMKYKEYLEDKVIITELGVLRAWKLLFEKLNDCDQDYSLLQAPSYLIYNFNYLYRIIIMEQERCINSFTNVYHALITSSLLAYLDNPTFEFFRSYYFFIKEKDNFTDRFREYEFGLIYDKFYQKYNMSIEEYFEGMYILIKCKFEVNFNGIKETKNLSDYNMLMSCEIINDPESRKKVEKVLQILSFTFEEGKKWSIDTKNNDLDFTLFQERPIYKINNDLYVPITRKYIDDQLFNSFIYKIRKLYDDDDTTFWKLLGKMFEQYVSYILNETCKNINNKFKILPEFKFGSKRSRKDSSDLYIIDDHNVCVIELKAARPINDVYKFNNKTAIEESIKKVITVPLKQSIKRTNEITNSNTHNELTSAKNYYFLAITLKNFPIYFNSYVKLREIIQNSQIKIKSINNLSIEEFELLCGAIGQGNHNIFFFLEEYSEKMLHYDSFKNYINNYVKGYPKNFFEELTKDVKKFTDNINL